MKSKVRGEIIDRVTIRPAFFIENPAFCFGQTEQFDLGYANVSPGKSGQHEMGREISKKKKGQHLLRCTYYAVFGLEMTQNVQPNK